MKFLFSLLHKIAAVVLLFEIILASGRVYATTPERPPSGSEDESCVQQSGECTEIDEWHFAFSVGAGIRTNPLRNGKDIPLVILPEISYYGENFFIQNLEFGYTLIDTPGYMLNIIASPSYDRVFFERWDLGNIFVDTLTQSTFGELPPGVSGVEFVEISDSNLTSRKYSILSGLEYSTQFNHTTIQLSVLTDITSVHSGTEARFAFSQQLHPAISTTVGFTWKDKNLTDYYYGVNANEITDSRGIYNANSSFNPFIRFSWLINPGQKNSWQMSFDYQMLDKQISNSPLVDDKFSMTFFVGKHFDFD